MMICPVCAQKLLREASVWRCENGHSFDIARQGHVNLLTTTQKHSLHPGDTREMIIARRAFLEAGYYAPIAQTLCELTQKFCPQVSEVLDVGCGEGYYLSVLHNALPDVKRFGIDISKDAVRYCAARDKDAQWITASAVHLPFSDASFDCLFSMFAVLAAQEFWRVLREGGIFVQVLAGERHLTSLKRIIYPSVLQKEKCGHSQIEGFQLLRTQTLEFPFVLNDRESIHNLLYMTPHVWRISKEGARTLERTAYLEERAEIIFNIYCRHEVRNLIK